MARRLRLPSYRLHKQSGQAIVTLPDGLGGRQDILLGAFDSPESPPPTHAFSPNGRPVAADPAGCRPIRAFP